MDDPYKVLGVERGATQDQIKRAYRKLAKTHHPDLNPGNAAAEATFKGVTAANDLLSDPERRGRFDRGEIDAAGQARAPQSSYRDHAEGDQGRRYGPDGAGSGRWEGGGLDEDDFASIFGAAFGGGRGRAAGGARRGADERYTLAADFLDALNGATQTLNLPGGRTLKARIPPGATDGQVLRLRGQGAPGRGGGPAGDALIEMSVAPHPVFRLDGRDIRMDLPITLKAAVLGGAMEAPTPGGPVRVVIPPNSDTGSELRLRGRGAPAHGGRPAGDLYATLRVVIGPPDAALKAFLETWTPEAAEGPVQSDARQPTEPLP